MAQKTYVYVTPFFPSEENWRGGFSLDAVRALERAGWRVEVFVGRTGRDGATTGDYEYEGVRVHRFRRVLTPCELVPFMVEGWNTRSFLRSFVAAGLRAEDVSVVHVNTVFFAAYAVALKTANPKIVAALQHHFSPPFHLRSGRLGELPVHATLLYRHWRKRCGQMDVQVFTSERSRGLFARDETGGELRSHLTFGRFFKDFARTAEYVLYNGVELPVGESPICRPVGVTGREGARIGCVANFFPGKGQMTLLWALVRLAENGRRVKAVFVGSGETLATCRQFAEEKKLNAEFLPEMPHKDMSDFYRSLDLYVLPSSYAEGFNCTCVEAHGCGVPVIGCSGTSLEEAFGDERDRWLVAPGDDNHLAELIGDFLDAPVRQNWKLDLDIDRIMADWTREVCRFVDCQNGGDGQGRGQGR